MKYLNLKPYQRKTVLTRVNNKLSIESEATLLNKLENGYYRACDGEVYIIQKWLVLMSSSDDQSQTCLRQCWIHPDCEIERLKK